MTDVTSVTRPTTSEIIAMAMVADERIRQFFREAGQLSPAQIEMLSRTSGAPTISPLSLGVDPCFLAAVASGAWTSTHRSLSVQVHEAARVTAAGLVRFGRRRRRLAHVLADAALVVLADADPSSPLSDSLRARLAAPWAAAVGSWPGRVLEPAQ